MDVTEMFKYKYHNYTLYLHLYKWAEKCLKGLAIFIVPGGVT